MYRKARDSLSRQECTAQYYISKQMQTSANRIPGTVSLNQHLPPGCTAGPYLCHGGSRGEAYRGILPRAARANASKERNIDRCR